MIDCRLETLHLTPSQRTPAHVLPSETHTSEDESPHGAIANGTVTLTKLTDGVETAPVAIDAENPATVDTAIATPVQGLDINAEAGSEVEGAEGAIASSETLLPPGTLAPDSTAAPEPSNSPDSVSDPADTDLSHSTEHPEPLRPLPPPSIPLIVHWASLGSLQKIQQNLAEFSNINVAGPAGYTALHAAAEYGHVEVVQFLLTQGGDCSVRYVPQASESPYAGFTPLMLAEKMGHHEVAELIRTKMEADQAQRLAAAPRPRVQHSPIVKQAIADVAASARQSQPRVVGHNHSLGEKHLDVTYVFANRTDLQTARRNGKCEWLQFETRAALRKRGFPLQIYPTINIWFKDKTEFYVNEGR